MPDLNCWGGDIIPQDRDGYKPKLAMLRCTCGARGFHTKNIGYIGARTIYGFPGGCNEMKKMITAQACTCEGTLSVDKELIEHVKYCKRCKEYGF